MREIVAGRKYRHFKGKEYTVLMIAYDCELPERKLVIYQAEYDDRKIWVRDYEVFMSPIDRDKYPDVEQEYRFEQIEKDKVKLK